MAQRRPKPLRAAIPYEVRNQVWRDMLPTGRTGRKLVASFPQRTGLMRHSYRCFRSGRKFLRVAFGRRVDYWAYQRTRRGQRVPVAIVRAMRRSIRRRKVLDTVHRLIRGNVYSGIAEAMLRPASPLREIGIAYRRGRRIASFIIDF